MGIVSHYQTPEAAEALRRQRKAATASSLVIALLAVTLIGTLLALVLLPGLSTSSPTLVTYNAPMPEDDPARPEQVNTQVQRKPSAPSSAMSKVIASTSVSPVAVPVPETVVEPSLDFGDGDDFGSGWGSGDGDGAGGTSFFGQAVRAERIAYVIDFSSSMGSQGRADLMRKELTKSLNQITHGTRYAIVFFSCVAWVAGDKLDLDRKGGHAVVQDRQNRRFKWKNAGGGRGWIQDGRKQQIEWLSASKAQLDESRSIVQGTPLSSGTAWDNPLEMVLEMNPLPQVVYFMTDGVASGSDRWARTIGAKAKEKGVLINCIALMEPRAHDDMAELAKRSGGQFTIVTKDGKHKRVR